MYDYYKGVLQIDEMESWEFIIGSKHFWWLSISQWKHQKLNHK